MQISFERLQTKRRKSSGSHRFTSLDATFSLSYLAVSLLSSATVQPKNKHTRPSVLAGDRERQFPVRLLIFT